MGTCVTWEGGVSSVHLAKPEVMEIFMNVLRTFLKRAVPPTPPATAGGVFGQWCLRPPVRARDCRIRGVGVSHWCVSGRRLVVGGGGGGGVGGADSTLAH